MKAARRTEQAQEAQGIADPFAEPQTAVTDVPNQAAPSPALQQYKEALKEVVAKRAAVAGAIPLCYAQLKLQSNYGTGNGGPSSMFHRPGWKGLKVNQRSAPAPELALLPHGVVDTGKVLIPVGEFRYLVRAE